MHYSSSSGRDEELVSYRDKVVLPNWPASNLVATQAVLFLSKNTIYFVCLLRRKYVDQQVPGIDDEEADLVRKLSCDNSSADYFADFSHKNKQFRGRPAPGSPLLPDDSSAPWYTKELKSKCQIFTALQAFLLEQEICSCVSLFVVYKCPPQAAQDLVEQRLSKRVTFAMGMFPISSLGRTAGRRRFRPVYQRFRRTRSTASDTALGDAYGELTLGSTSVAGAYTLPPNLHFPRRSADVSRAQHVGLVGQTRHGTVDLNKRLPQCTQRTQRQWILPS